MMIHGQAPWKSFSSSNSSGHCLLFNDIFLVSDNCITQKMIEHLIDLLQLSCVMRPCGCYSVETKVPLIRRNVFGNGFVTETVEVYTCFSQMNWMDC